MQLIAPADPGSAGDTSCSLPQGGWTVGSAESLGFPIERIRDNDDFRAWLERFRPDVVIIETPCDAHAKQARLTLECGVRWVLCEKLIATSAAEGAELARWSARLGPEQGLDYIDHYLLVELVDHLLANVVSFVGEVRHVHVELFEKGPLPPAQERAHFQGMAGKTRYNALMVANTPGREQYYRYLPPKIPLTAIRRFALRIAEKFDPEKIILFGSFAYGTPHEWSDVDLLVVMPTYSEARQASRIKLAFEPEFPLDLIVRTPKRLRFWLAEGDSFLQEITSKGTVLYEKDNPRVGATSSPPRRARISQAPFSLAVRLCG